MATTSDASLLDLVSKPDPEPPRVVIHMPVNVRSASIAFIAIAIAIALLRWTQEFIVPVLLGVVLSYALTPLVDRLQRMKVPRMAGAGLVLALILAAFAGGTYLLRGQAVALVTSLPQVAKQIREAAAGRPGEGEGALATVQRAANELESTAKSNAPSSPATSASNATKPTVGGSVVAQPTRVVVEKAGINVRDYVLTGSLGLAAFAGQVLVVIFVALFLLGSGNTFRKKMVVLAGPTLTQRRVTVQALDEVHTQIQRYLLVQVVTSVLVGVLTWIVFLMIGLKNSAVWGVVAAVANLVPYVGSLATSGAAAVVGFVQFDDVNSGLLLAASSFVVHLIVGNLVTPWLTGRSSRMSPFVVFVGVLFFGWLWGVAGLILAFPLMVAVKIVCDRVDDLKPIGQLLGA